MNETLQPQETNAATLEAQKRVKKIKRFYKNLASWAGTSVFLIALDLFLSGGITWSKWPVFFWGITIVMEVFEVIRLQRMDKNWEDRMLRKHSGQSALPDPENKNDEDYSDDLLRNPEEPEKEKANLSEFRKLKRPWKDEDLV
jgi:lipopolysaccharide/colanic/teichoic acid biosynthesis glycosyltransferase